MSTPKPAQNQNLDRRRFFRGVAGAATAAVAVPLGAATPAHAYDPGREESKARYQESEQVKAFYRSNGYETKK